MTEKKERRQHGEGGDESKIDWERGEEKIVSKGGTVLAEGDRMWVWQLNGSKEKAFSWVCNTLKGGEKRAQIYS